MNLKIRLALAAIAAALMAFAIGRPLYERFLSPASALSTGSGVRARALAEEAARQEEFASRRPAILAEMRALQLSGDDAGAMKLGALYFGSHDAELQQLYRAAADSVGRRQRLAQYAALIARECTEDKAVALARQKLEGHGPYSPQVSGGPFKAHRVMGQQARDDINAYLTDVAAHPPPKDDGLQDHERDEANGVPRLHSDFRTGLTSGALTDELLCLWKIDSGLAAKQGSSTELWIAPSARGTEVESAIIVRDKS